MEIPAGHLRNKLEEWADERNASPVDRKQRKLTDGILVPEQEQIEEELMAIRRVCDEKTRATLKEVARKWPAKWKDDPSIRHPLQYPIGYCDTITNGVWRTIRALMQYPTIPGMRTLNRFVKKGGVLKRIDGIRHGKCFQNCIQAGGLWIDVAGDTMDTTNPPVEVCPMEASGFENLDDPTACAEIFESYWHHEVYPNNLFPFLAPFYPSIMVSQRGVIQICYMTRGMLASNALANFRPAEDFIFKSDFSDKELPPEFNKLIGKHFSWDEDTYDFDCGEPHSDVFCRGGAPKDFLANIFERLRNMDSQHLSRLLEVAIATANKIDDLELRI